jgi:hypothetical protein
MPRLSLDLDPALLSRVRALANRRGLRVDQIVNDLIRDGLRHQVSREDPAATPRPKPVSLGPEAYDHLPD